jgi:hypothetical protein
MNSYPGDAHLMSIDPIKAERLEQRLTASNSTTNLLMGGANGANSSEPPRPSLLNTPNITLEEEEVSDQEEVPASGRHSRFRADDNLTPPL